MSKHTHMCLAASRPSSPSHPYHLHPPPRYLSHVTAQGLPCPSVKSGQSPQEQLSSWAGCSSSPCFGQGFKWMICKVPANLSDLVTDSCCHSGLWHPSHVSLGFSGTMSHTCPAQRACWELSTQDMAETSSLVSTESPKIQSHSDASCSALTC